MTLVLRPGLTRSFPLTRAEAEAVLNTLAQVIVWPRLRRPPLRLRGGRSRLALCL